jgi:hypothetical protein
MSIDPECLLNVLRDDRSVSDLRTYFNIDNPHDPPLYTGARFEALDGGGARDEVRDKITPWDLLALQCLSVTMPTPVALDLVEGPFGEGINELLRRIPGNVLLGEPGAKEYVVDGSSAGKAWKLLKTRDDVGFVIAGKLMARKRPHLIPVWDNVVKCAFGRPKNAWLSLDALISQPGGAVKKRLDELHQEAQLSELVSRLRVLDVVVWMRHHFVHRRHQSSNCPGLCGR